MMPIPPSRAIVMAARLSVTESIAAEKSGMFRSKPRQSRVLTSTSFGRTSLYAGTSRTSSNVRHSLSVSSSMPLYSSPGAACERCSGCRPAPPVIPRRSFRGASVGDFLPALRLLLAELVDPPRERVGHFGVELRSAAALDLADRDLVR